MCLVFKSEKWQNSRVHCGLYRRIVHLNDWLLQFYHIISQNLATVNDFE